MEEAALQAAPSVGPSVGDQIAAVESTMFNADGTKNAAYWNSGEATQRYSELLAARDGSAEPVAPARSDAPAPSTQAAAEHVAPAERGNHDYDLGDLAGDADFENFGTVMASTGASGELFEAILDGFADPTDYTSRDVEDRTHAEQHLRKVWGADFDAKRDMVAAYMRNNLPPGMERMLTTARVAGMALLNDPQLVADLAAHAERAPKMPAPSGNLAEDIAAIERVMGDDPEGYRRDLGLQARLRSLYETRTRGQG